MKEVLKRLFALLFFRKKNVTIPEIEKPTLNKSIIEKELPKSPEKVIPDPITRPTPKAVRNNVSMKNNLLHIHVWGIIHKYRCTSYERARQIVPIQLGVKAFFKDSSGNEYKII